jgi:hypothetical protein
MNYLEIKVEDCKYLADYVISALKVYGCKTIGDCKKLLNMYRDYPDVFPKTFNIYPHKYFKQKFNIHKYRLLGNHEQNQKMLTLIESKTYKHQPGSHYFYENGELKEYYIRGSRLIDWIKSAIKEYEEFENAIDIGIVYQPYSSINTLTEIINLNYNGKKHHDICNLVKEKDDDKTIVYFKLVPGTARTSQDYSYYKITFIYTSLED